MFSAKISSQEHEEHLFSQTLRAKTAAHTPPDSRPRLKLHSSTQHAIRRKSMFFNHSKNINSSYAPRTLSPQAQTKMSKKGIYHRQTSPRVCRIVNTPQNERPSFTLSSIKLIHNSLEHFELCMFIFRAAIIKDAYVFLLS